MRYLETKFKVRKRYSFLGIAVLIVLYYSNIANSQVVNTPYVKDVHAGNDVIAPKKDVVSPVKVAIIDSNFGGVDVRNFPGKLETYDIASGSSTGVTADIVNKQGEALDENNSHGGKVLKEFMVECKSLDRGCAPDVLLVKVSEGSDADGKVSSTRVAKGIRYAVQDGAKVINMSLGTLQRTDDVLSAIGYAHSKGAVIVAASGNWGEKVGVDRKTMSVYAQNQNVIAVGAMDYDGNIAPYTSGVGNRKLEFLAKPRFGSGTSLATPIVSADIASMLGGGIGFQDDVNGNGNWDLHEIEKRLSAMAEKEYPSIRISASSL